MWRVLGATTLLSLLGFGLLFVTGQKFDLDGFVKLVRLDPIFLLLLLPTLFGWWFAAAWRTQLLCQNPNVTIWRAIRALLLSLFGAAVTPSATGASLSLAWYLSRYISPQRATVVAVYGLVLDLVYYAWSLPVCFVVLTVMNVNLNFPIIGPVLGVFVGLGSLVTLGLAYGLAFHLNKLRSLVHWLLSPPFLRRFQEPAGQFLLETGQAMTEIRQMPASTQLLLHFSTALGFLLHFGAANVVAAAVGLPLDHIVLLATQSIVVAFSFLVPLPGGAGFLEVFLGRSAQASGIPAEAVVPFVAIWRFLSYYLYVIIGPFIGGPAILAASQKKNQE
jgi:glycosyltransferase 2 family protein